MDRATVNLPSADFDRTERFYAAVGFATRFRDHGWMILQRGAVELEPLRIQWTRSPQSPAAAFGSMTSMDFATRCAANRFRWRRSGDLEKGFADGADASLEPIMPMRVGMRLAEADQPGVRVPMVLVVDVAVRMRQRLVHMLMVVVLGEMQPHADPMSAPATPSWTVTGSPRTAIASTAPKNGAVEK